MINLELQILIEMEKVDTITYKSLTRKLSFSEGTIRTRIKNINESSNEYGASIVSKLGVGLELKIHNLVIFQKKMEEKKQYDNTTQTPTARVVSISDYLLLNEDFTNLSDLSERLHVSRSTLSNDLVSVRGIFDLFNLELKDFKRKGVRLFGLEEDKRRCLSYLNKKYKNLAHRNESYASDILIIEEIVQESIKTYDFFFSGLAFNNLCEHLYITIYRIRNVTNHLEISDLIEKFDLTDLPLNQANSLSEKLEDKFKVVFSKNERIYLAIQIAGKQNIFVNSLKDESIVGNEDVFSLVSYLLEEVHTYWQIDFREDDDLFMNLGLHIKPMLFRLRSGFTQENPMLEEIQERLGLAYMVATGVARELEKILNLKVPASEIGFLALHINLALMKKGQAPYKKKILLVCSTGYGSSKLLEYTIKKHFNSSISEIRIASLYELNELDLNDIDMIFTTVKIGKEISTPVLMISNLLVDSDLVAIERILLGNKENETASYFSQELFFSDITGSTKEEVLTEIVARIKQVKSLPENFLNLIFARENLGSTDFGNLVAIPHPQYLITDNTFGVVAILDKPIKWQNNDVQVIILTSLQKDFKKEIMSFYETISIFISQKEMINKIIKSRSFDMFMKEIKLINGSDKNEKN